MKSVKVIKVRDGSLYGSRAEALKHVEKKQYAYGHRIANLLAQKNVYEIMEVLPSKEVLELMAEFLEQEKDKNFEGDNEED